MSVNNQVQMAALMPLFEPFLDLIVEKVCERLEPVLKEPKKVEQKFYSRDEACQLLHISKPTLKKLSDEGILNPIRMGDRRVLFDAFEIQQVIDSKTSLKHRK